MSLGFAKITMAILFLAGFQQSLNAQLPRLDSETFADYRNAIEPTSEESAFLKINWFSELGEAVRLAHKTEKPLLVYVMNGHPLACT